MHSILQSYLHLFRINSIYKFQWSMQSINHISPNLNFWSSFFWLHGLIITSISFLPVLKFKIYSIDSYKSNLFFSQCIASLTTWLSKVLLIIIFDSLCHKTPIWILCQCLTEFRTSMEEAETRLISLSVLATLWYDFCGGGFLFCLCSLFFIFLGIFSWYLNFYILSGYA